jgi:transposase-like protein
MTEQPTLRTEQQRAGWAHASENPDQATVTGIAAAAGVSTGTAAKWLRQWREQLGDDLFRSEAATARAEQTLAAREAVELMWDDLHLTEARNAGVTAGRIRTKMLELLPSVATVRVDRGADGQSEPVLVPGPPAREIEQLSRAYVRLLEAAELMSGRPTRHTRRSVPSDQWQPAVPADAMSDEEKRAKVLDIRERLLERRAAGG